MSFDVFLQTHNYTGETRTETNPFTRREKTVRVNEGVSEIERRSIVEFIDSFAPGGADEHGCIGLVFGDGGSAEFFAKHLHDDESFTGCMFAIRSAFTPELLDAIWRVANLGRMSIFPAMEDSQPIVTDSDHVELIPSEAGEPVVCESPAELGRLLESGFSRWDEYRRQILDEC
jgi:hypothetical protein